jgi:hypothetical protein
MMRRAFPVVDDIRGVGVIVMFGVIMLLIYFCALVIDLGKAEYTTHVIQHSVDAASLAGAAELVRGARDDLTRWTNSKRAVLAILKLDSLLPFYDFPDITISSNHQGVADYCETGDYRWQIYDNNEMRIEIERGVYTENAGGFLFDPRESDTSCNADADPYPNAVRVTLTVYDYPNFFATVLPFGRPTFPVLTRTAIGAEVK